MKAAAVGISDAVRQIDAVLPQTQCTRCGEPDCLAYAKAIVDGAQINRCPPGGAQGIARLAALTGRPVSALDPACGDEGPRRLAWIDESACIGCTLCIKACPVDCIVGAAKRMHTVIESLCTGCELCLPACPVDCIHLDVATPGRSGWAAWSEQQAHSSRELYRRRTLRIQQESAEESQRLESNALQPAAPQTGASDAEKRQRAIEQALALARERRKS